MPTTYRHGKLYSIGARMKTSILVFEVAILYTAPHEGYDRIDSVSFPRKCTRP